MGGEGKFLAREGIVSGLGLLLGGAEGVFGDYLTNADQDIPD